MSRVCLPSQDLAIAHTSDTHLGDPYGHPESKTALRKVVDKVRLLRSDYLVISGDVFDNQRVGEDAVGFFLEEINRVEIPVIILPGNHDLMNETSIYKRPIFDDSPPNLFIFANPNGQLISFDHIDFWGKAMDEHSPSFRPIEGMPKPASGKWLVSAAHGHFQQEDSNSGRSSLIFAEAISSLKCDYLALGHWDLHTDISQNNVMAVYSGCPMGVGGKPGSITMVELNNRTGVAWRQVFL